MTVVIEESTLQPIPENEENTTYSQTNGPMSTIESREEKDRNEANFTDKDETCKILDEGDIAAAAIRSTDRPKNSSVNSALALPPDSPNDNHEIGERIPLRTYHSRISANQNFHQLNHRTSFLSTHKSDIYCADGAVDDVDSLPSHMSFNCLDAMALLLSICTYFFDIITDATVATIHYRNQNYWYFALTCVFIAFPMLVMTCINLRWYIVDSLEPTSPKATKCQWFLRLMCLLLQLGPIMRYIDSMIFGFKFRKFKKMHGIKSRITRRHFQYMIYEDTDASMLRLFECFLEAAPQLVLQLYIMAVDNRMLYGNTDWTVTVQAVSVFASLTSLSWSLVSYARMLRMSLPTKVNLGWSGTIVQFLWRYFMIASRVIALALFASVFTYYIGIVCALHWLVMFAWIVSMKTNFCNNLPEELFYNAVLAIIFIFCYFNPVDSPTRKRYSFYYAFCFAENILLISFWFSACNTEKWYRFPAFVAFFVFFAAGLVFMIFYYLKLHPTKNIRLCGSTPKSGNEEDDEQRQESPIALSTSHLVYSISGNVEGLPDGNDKANGNNNRENSGHFLKPSRNSKNMKYLRQFSGVWITQNRLPHPRPTITS